MLASAVVVAPWNAGYSFAEGEPSDTKGNPPVASGEPSASEAATSGAEAALPATAPVEPEALPPSPSGVSAATAGVSQPAPAAEITFEALKQETFDVARRLSDDFPNSTDGLALLGSVYWHYSNSVEATRCWQQCIERDPKRADAYHGLAAIAVIKGDFEDAAQLSLKAQALEPNLPGSYGRYAEALMGLGKPKEAVAALEKEIELSPHCGVYFRLMGQAHLQCQEFEKARQDFEKALELLPSDSMSHHGLSHAFARLHQPDSAKQHAEQFNALRAKEKGKETVVLDERRKEVDQRVWASRVAAKTYTDAALPYLASGNSEKAEQYWRRAASLDPKNAVCRQHLVESCMKRQQGNEALEFCEQLRAIDPDNAIYQLNTGVLLAQLQQFDQAEETLRKAIQLAPNHPNAYRSLILLLTSRNHRLDEAKTLAQKLVEVEPTSFNYVTLGDVCYRNADLPGALAAMKRASELEPGSERIGRAYQWLQQRERK